MASSRTGSLARSQHLTSTMPATRNGALRCYNVGMVLACLVGLGLSYYLHIVNTSMKGNESYEAMCDIAEQFSCTKVLTAEFNRGFGLLPKHSVLNVPNYFYGIGFYFLIGILSTINSYRISAAVVALSVLSNIFNIYLAYLLYLLQNICVVCVSTYIVNMVIAFFAVKKFRRLLMSDKHKKRR